MSRKKFQDKPWITPGIMKSISTKNILYRKYVKKPTALLKDKLSSYRRILQRTIRSAQSLHYKSILTRRPASSRQSWSVVNTLIKGKKKTQSPPVNSIIHRGLTYSDNLGVANAFNDYFSSVGSTLSQGLYSDVSPVKYLGNAVPHSVFFSPITEDELYKYVSTFKPNKASGLDGIPP